MSAVSEGGVEWGDRESVLWSVRRGDGGGGWGVCGMWCVCGVDGWVSGWMDGCIAGMEDGVGWWVGELVSWAVCGVWCGVGCWGLGSLWRVACDRGWWAGQLGSL